MPQARLNGIILDDGGAGCEARFQYGLTVALGTFTPWQGGYLLVTGDTFSTLVTDLLGGTQYFFQAEVRNAIGTGLGAIISLWCRPLGGGRGLGTPVTFITGGSPGSGPPPEVASIIASAIGEHDTQINGIIINDQGSECSTMFEYGGSSAYGSKTRWVDGAVTGSTFSEVISLLGAGLDFHYRAVAQNRFGIGYGADIVFTTRKAGSGSEFPGELIYPLLAEMEA